MFGIRQSKRLLSQYIIQNFNIKQKLIKMIEDYNKNFNKSVKEQLIMFNKILCYIIIHFRIIILGSNNETKLENMLTIIINKLILTKEEINRLNDKLILNEKIYIKFINNRKKVLDLCYSYFIYKINIFKDKLNPDLLINLRQYIY